ncbi:MAG: AhpC/TSA family protein [Mucilaginibacter sp.]|nr:AhpC/TSA family protein [Mucilaginibacter sp.]
MKSINLIFCAFALVISQTSGAQTTQQNQFTLTGKLSPIGADSVSLSYVNAMGKYTQVTKPVKKGRFSLNGKINNPTAARLLLKKAGKRLSEYEQQTRAREFYIEPGQLTLTGNPLDSKTLTLKGSKSQEDYLKLDAKIQPIRQEMEPLEKALMNEKDHEKASAIRDKFEPYQARIKQVTYQFFTEHPDSYVTLNMLGYYVSSMGLDSTKKIYNAFSDAFRGSENGKEIAKSIQRIEKGLPGAKAAMFTKTDINGKTLALKDFAGKYVLLDFWASWCVPCRKSNPHMIELYHKYKDSGLEVIGIADDDGKLNVWKQAVEKDGVGIWHNVLRGLDWDKLRNNIPNPDDLDDQYGIASIPTKILIDPNGKIIGRYGDTFGGTEEDMDKMLQTVFNK